MFLFSFNARPHQPPPPFRGCMSQYWYIQMRSPVNNLNGIANAAMTGVSQRIDVVMGSFEMSRQPTCVLCGPIYLFVLCQLSFM